MGACLVMMWGPTDIDYIGPNGAMYTANSSNLRSESATNLTRRAIFVCAIAVILAGAVYLNALDNPFVYDDHRIVVENRSLTDLSNMRAILWHEVTRPVVNFSYALDRAIWGTGPFGFHLTNVLLHMINVGLFALLAWRVAEDRAQRPRPTPSAVRAVLVAPVAALLFAVHPMMASAVGYISGRSEIICGTFFFIALLSARQWMLGRSRLWLAPVVAAWGIALGAKEIAAMFPFLVLAYDRGIMPSDPAEHRRRLLWLHFPLFAIAVGLVAIRLIVFLTVEHGGGVEPQWRFVLVEFEVVRRYVTMLLVPSGQAIFHVVTPFNGPADARAWPGIGAVVLLSWLAWSQRRAHAAGSFGLIWFLLLLAPSSALVVLDRGEPMAEHRVYLASCGLFLAVAFVADRVAAKLATKRAAQLVLATGMAGVIIALAGRTLIRNAVWARSSVVWLEAAERAPEAWLPHLLLGEELHREGRHDQASAAFRRVIALRPQEVTAYAKLGVCLSEQGDLDAAERAFATLRERDARSPEASNGLATVALLRGQADAARRGYLATIALDPSNIAARRGMAVLEETAGGNPTEALRWCEEIRRIAPDTPGNDECISRNTARIAGGRDAGR